MQNYKSCSASLILSYYVNIGYIIGNLETMMMMALLIHNCVRLRLHTYMPMTLSAMLDSWNGSPAAHDHAEPSGALLRGAGVMLHARKDAFQARAGIGYTDGSDPIQCCQCTPLYWIRFV
jgi:hypothetical protein